MPDNSLFNTFYLQGNSYDTNEGIILTNEETLISRSLSEPFRVKDSTAFLARSFVFPFVYFFNFSSHGLLVISRQYYFG